MTRSHRPRRRSGRRPRAGRAEGISFRPAARAPSNPPAGKVKRKLNLNRKLVRNALQFVCLAGHPNMRVRQEVLQKIDEEYPLVESFVVVSDPRQGGRIS